MKKSSQPMYFTTLSRVKSLMTTVKRAAPVMTQATMRTSFCRLSARSIVSVAIVLIIPLRIQTCTGSQQPPVLRRDATTGADPDRRIQNLAHPGPGEADPSSSRLSRVRADLRLHRSRGLVGGRSAAMQASASVPLGPHVSIVRSSPHTIRAVQLACRPAGGNKHAVARMSLVQAVVNGTGPGAEPYK